MTMPVAVHRVLVPIAALIVVFSAASCGDDDTAALDGGDSAVRDSARPDSATADSAVDSGTTDAGSTDGAIAVDSFVPGDAGPARRVTFTPSDAPITNPERGFYRYTEITSERDLGYVREGGDTLVYSYVRLDDYRDGDIAPTLLDDAASGLAAARDAGLKVVLRFAYNEGPYPDPDPDASLERVLAHIGQVEPLLRENEDVIAVVQAGFIGAWGEWHSSTHGLDGDPDARAMILSALLDAMPASRSTQMRYPPYKEAIFGGPLTEAEAWSGNHEARTGHHNDCFVSSETDVGTYPDGEVERWTDYVASDTQFVPMGGETCAVFPARSGCEFAPGEMERLHFSFVNRDYHTDVVAGWQDGGCLEEIERRLGYRFVLLDADLPETPSATAIAVRVRLRNDGWAAPFNARTPYLVLDGPGGTTTVALDSEDARQWLAGREVTLTGTLVPAAPLPSGTYRVALWLPDASPSIRDRADYAIRTANESTWDESHGWNVLGEVVIP